MSATTPMRCWSRTLSASSTATPSDQRRRERPTLLLLGLAGAERVGANQALRLHDELDRPWAGLLEAQGHRHLLALRQPPLQMAKEKMVAARLQLDRHADRQAQPLLQRVHAQARTHDLDAVYLDLPGRVARGADQAVRLRAGVGEREKSTGLARFGGLDARPGIADVDAHQVTSQLGFLVYRIHLNGAPPRPRPFDWPASAAR